MASRERIFGNDGSADAAQGNGGVTPSRNTRAAPSYPSPTPSAVTSLYSSPVPPQAPMDLDGRKPPGSGARNAKDYWKLVYAASDQRSEPKNKRKDHNGTEDHGRPNKLQAVGIIAAPRMLKSSEALPPPADAHEDGQIARIEQDNVLGGPRAPEYMNQDEQMQLLKRGIGLDNLQAHHDLRQLYTAALSFGHDKCKLVGGKWELDGFGTSLYHHQVIGVSWMLSRELHPTAPNGGILADGMGLGKTVQLLACISQNLPRKKAKALKTLIVAPKRLLGQWFDEIKSHCSNERTRRVFIYVASQVKTDSQWEDETIILTNYSQLQRQLPSEAKLLKIEQLRQRGDPRWKKVLRDEGGSLFQTDWHRVVLDEGHAINNRTSNTSRACRLLFRKCSWVLTGTPLTNKPEELFTYLDFIRSRYSRYGDYQDAMGDTANDEQKANLRETYQGISLNRRVSDQLMGQPILQIPDARPTELVLVQFSQLEANLHRPNKERLHELRELSRSLKSPDRLTVVPTGELRRLFNYLRYFTSHPALVEPTYLSKQALEPDVQQNMDTQESINVQEDTKIAGAPVQHYFCTACCNALVDPMTANCGHALCKGCVMKHLSPKEQRRTYRCRSCGTAVETAKEAGDECFRHTLHYFERLTKRFSGSGRAGNSERKKRVRKPGDDEFGLQPRLARERKHGKRKAKAKAKKGRKNQGRRNKAIKDRALEQIRTNAGAFLKGCDQRPWDPIPHSAKTSATMDLVKKWQREAPDDKIIIFVQWIPVLSFLGRMLFQSGFKFVYLWGEMEASQQEMCIRAFKSDPEIKVMLISVSCGAHGLNLTAANRAIVFDHWWHEGWERQAFARIHRIGQTKEVHTAKLVAAGSMDETIMTMQATKKETISAAVGDGTAPPKHHGIYDQFPETGSLDEGGLEIERLDDFSDEESGDGEDDGSESESESDGESGSDDEDSDSDAVSRGSDGEYLPGSPSRNQGGKDDHRADEGDSEAGSGDE